MNDTSADIQARTRRMMMDRSGEERFLMGALMFDAAREMVIASMPKDLSSVEFKRRLFERIYGVSLESVVDPAQSPFGSQSSSSSSSSFDGS